MEAIKKLKLFTLVFCIFFWACASTHHSKPRSEIDNFRGVRWGAEIATLEGMERVEQDKSSSPDVVWYRRTGETLTFGQAKVENVFYSFWMGSFESVWIDFRGEDNFELIKKELFERFGKVLESRELLKRTEKEALMERSGIRPGADQFYFWDGKETEMWLSYSKDRRKGEFSINSKKITEERRDYEKERERMRKK